MVQEEGYYWVLISDDAEWTVGFCSSGKWMVLTSLEVYEDNFFYKIGERILPPVN